MAERTKLVDLAAKHGVENLRVFYPARPLQSVAGLLAFTSSNDPQTVVEGRIDEDRYKVKDGYKMTVRALDETFAYESYYISDFESLSETAPDDFYIMVGDEKFTLGWSK